MVLSIPDKNYSALIDECWKNKGKQKYMFLVNISVCCSSWYLVHVKRKRLEIIKVPNCGYWTECGKKYIKILNMTYFRSFTCKPSKKKNL